MIQLTNRQYKSSCEGCSCQINKLLSVSDYLCAAILCFYKTKFLFFLNSSSTAVIIFKYLPDSIARFPKVYFDVACLRINNFLYASSVVRFIANKLISVTSSNNGCWRSNPSSLKALFNLFLHKKWMSFRNWVIGRNSQIEYFILLPVHAMEIVRDSIQFHNGLHPHEMALPMWIYFQDMIVSCILWRVLC